MPIENRVMALKKLIMALKERGLTDEELIEFVRLLDESSKATQ